MLNVWLNENAFFVLLSEQVALYHRIAALPDDNILRDSIFEHGTSVAKMFTGKRRRGRPRVRWVSAVHAMATCNEGY